jgi:hypothetical protein
MPEFFRRNSDGDLRGYDTDIVPGMIVRTGGPRAAIPAPIEDVDISGEMQPSDEWYDAMEVSFNSLSGDESNEV